MRSIPRNVIIAYVLVALLVPAVVYAVDRFYYTSTDGRTGGAGTPNDPEKAAMDEAFTICKNRYGKSDIVFWYNADYKYYCEFVPIDGGCVARRCPAGQPPGTGVDLPYPLVIGSLIGLGVLLMGAAWFLRQRRRRSV